MAFRGPVRHPGPRGPRFMLPGPEMRGPRPMQSPRGGGLLPTPQFMPPRPMGHGPRDLGISGSRPMSHPIRPPVSPMSHSMRPRMMQNMRPPMPLHQGSSMNQWALPPRSNRPMMSPGSTPPPSSRSQPTFMSPTCPMAMQRPRHGLLGTPMSMGSELRVNPPSAQMRPGCVPRPMPPMVASANLPPGPRPNMPHLGRQQPFSVQQSQPPIPDSSRSPVRTGRRCSDFEAGRRLPDARPEFVEPDQEASRPSRSERRSPHRSRSPQPRDGSPTKSHRHSRANKDRSDRPHRESRHRRRGSGHEIKEHRRKRHASADGSKSQERPRKHTRSEWKRRAVEVPCVASPSTSQRESEIEIEEVSSVDTKPEEKVPEEESYTPAWIRCSPADLYFKREKGTANIITTKKMKDLEEKFYYELVQKAERVRNSKPKYEKPPRPLPHTVHGGPCSHAHTASGSDSDSEISLTDSDDDSDIELSWMDELERKQKHPDRLHKELWFNEADEMNDGPLCRCSLKARRSGIRHDIYPGEEPVIKCEDHCNNADKLYHYRITMSPHTNFLTKNPTTIEHDNHEYIFEGFSLFAHCRLDNIPVCKVIRFNIEYTIHWFEEEMPENFSFRSLDLFTEYLFTELLELLDLDWRKRDKGCSRFHLMPRFARDLPDNGKEILSMNEVLSYLIRSSVPLLEETELATLLKYEQREWQEMVDEIRGMIVTCPGKKPAAIRVDQLDRQQPKNDVITYPMIVHFGIRPAQLSYAGDPNYQKLWKQYVKFKHLLANKPKVSREDKHKLTLKEEQLQEMRMKSNMKREVTVELSSEGFLRTGIKSDMCQHAMLLPVLICHLRFHRCLDVLEERIGYCCKDRALLQLALTHPSYRVNFGTNPDHARNSLSNCGIRQPEYGDRRIHHVHTRKRGINTLINIMSRMGKKEETNSEINHYERLEFLGDAVVEFLSSIHLYYMFPDLEEGGMATYRAAIVQNQHLAVLAKKLHIQDFMLYAHGPDLCHELDLRHAMANCFEALMGALFLDGGIEVADRVFAEVLFEKKQLGMIWMNLPPHPLQEDEPQGDRHWIKSSPTLQKLFKFEDAVGIEFTHIRLLARAFTVRNVGYNNLTLGHNQRLEFLGDTVLQLVASEYLYKHFPEHHEGHLSLLRSSLVNNRTQSVVCDDLGMTDYVIQVDTRPNDKRDMKHKEKADLLEAFIGALYVDKDLEYCQVFCQVCFFPRLKQFILNQDWNDPKSQLQQCCLTLRELDGGEPDIPTYKVIESTGPTNTRKYTVAVYFRGERLATGTGHSIQQAEMSAANHALEEKADLFPQLAHQKRYIEKKYKRKRRTRRIPAKTGPCNPDWETKQHETERKDKAWQT